MEFDYVIVGAGAAGCVLANRLSGLPKEPTVCLIERGPPNADSRWGVEMAGGFSYNQNYMNQPDLWLRYHTEPEKNLNGRRIDCPRGKGVGGSTLVNAMQFVRGQSGDFDRWAKQEYCSELWSFDKCLPYFKRLESYTPGFDPEDAIDLNAETECTKSIAQYRGSDGPLKVASGRLNNRKYSKCPLSPAFIRAAVQAGHKYNPDFNGAAQEGAAWMDSNISGGVRQSASRCYLLPALSRKNVNVVSNSTVSRVLLQEKQAVGVECIDSNGKKFSIKANKEVLLCAGAYNSPQILMLSGIGDPATLQKVGLETLHELPGVGRNLQDHLYLGLVSSVQKPETSFQPDNWRNSWADQMREKWLNGKEGWGSSSPFETCLIFKTNENQPKANMLCSFTPMLFDVQNDGSFWFKPGTTSLFIQERPSSTGRVTLSSTNPADDPIIEHNYLSSSSEVAEFVEGMKIVRKVLAQPAFADLLGDELFPGAQAISDEALEKYVRAGASSCFHPCGTCRMGDPEAAPTPEAARQLVVDTELRVCGLKGLRVVDASVMPSITSGNIQAPTLMIAERAADFIATTL